MNKATTSLEVTDTCDLEEGMAIDINGWDMRWWRRLYCFLLRRPRPMRTLKLEITGVTGGTTLTVEDRK